MALLLPDNGQLFMLGCLFCSPQIRSASNLPGPLKNPKIELDKLDAQWPCNERNLRNY